MLNKVIIIGRLTRDPEVKYTPSTGNAMAKFTVACEGYGKDADADFVPVTVWGKQAESCGTYLVKGSLVAVEGRFSSSKGKDDKTYYGVTGERVKFLSPKNRFDEDETPPKKEKRQSFDDDEDDDDDVEW